MFFVPDGNFLSSAALMVLYLLQSSKMIPFNLVQARGQSHKGTFSFIKDTEKVIDLGNQLQVHVEKINNNVGRLYFVATNQMPRSIVVREPNADRRVPWSHTACHVCNVYAVPAVVEAARHADGKGSVLVCCGTLVPTLIFGIHLLTWKPLAFVALQGCGTATAMARTPVCQAWL